VSRTSDELLASKQGAPPHPVSTLQGIATTEGFARIGPLKSDARRACTG